MLSGDDDWQVRGVEVKQGSQRQIPLGRYS